MPEGDTLYRTAVTLRKALLSRAITRFETTLPLVAAVDARAPVAGRIVEAVESRGKHLLIRLAAGHTAPEGMGEREYGCMGEARASSSPIHPHTHTPILPPDALVLHTHPGMPASWHLYRPGEAW